MTCAKTQIPRNEYFSLAQQRLCEGKYASLDDEYEIVPLTFSEYPLLSEVTKMIVDANFIEEDKDRHGEYMLRGHWMTDLSCQFADRCDFDLEYASGYSAYAFSDEQQALFTYCEGDITFSPYWDKKTYEKRKKEMLDFYKENY